MSASSAEVKDVSAEANPPSNFPPQSKLGYL